MEQTRLHAARLFAAQIPQAEIARRLDTDPKNVSRWHRTWLDGGDGGDDALRSAGPPGRTPKISLEQFAEIEVALRDGARAHGYPGDGWTLARIAEVICRRTGVRHHPGHVWRLLREHGWSAQRPAKRATERDDAALEQWTRVDWPRINKGQPDARQPSCFGTSSGSP